KGSDFARRALRDAIANGDPTPGRSIGPYRIERLIGHGGMGTVYSARNPAIDNAPLVAIKMISRGMDTANVIKSFHHEQRILAKLDHPNIAGIDDGGPTDDG